MWAKAVPLTVVKILSSARICFEEWKKNVTYLHNINLVKQNRTSEGASITLALGEYMFLRLGNSFYPYLFSQLPVVLSPASFVMNCLLCCFYSETAGITHPELGAHGRFASGCSHLLFIVSAADLLEQIIDEVQSERQQRQNRLGKQQLEKDRRKADISFVFCLFNFFEGLKCSQIFLVHFQKHISTYFQTVQNIADIMLIIVFIQQSWRSQFLKQIELAYTRFWSVQKLGKLKVDLAFKAFLVWKTKIRALMYNLVNLYRPNKRFYLVCFYLMRMSCLLSFSMFRMSSLNVSLFFSRIPLTSYRTW